VGVPKKPTGFFGYIPGCLNPVYSVVKGFSSHLLMTCLWQVVRHCRFLTQ